MLPHVFRWRSQSLEMATRRMHFTTLLFSSLISIVTTGSYGLMKRQAAASQACLELQEQYPTLVSMPNSTLYDYENTGQHIISTFSATGLTFALRILECARMAIPSLHCYAKLCRGRVYFREEFHCSSGSLCAPWRWSYDCSRIQ